jgi:hypothetical protein
MATEETGSDRTATTIDGTPLGPIESLSREDPDPIAITPEGIVRSLAWPFGILANWKYLAASTLEFENG